MTPRQIDLVQATFKDVAAIKDDAAALFYGRLFEMDPSLKSLFKGNIKEQGRKLMATIGLAVGSLRNPEKIIPAVKNLGEKHVEYGVKESHYATVGGALLWTLEKGLGPKFTPEVKDAWAATYGLVSSVMIEAAKDAPMKMELKALFFQALEKKDQFAK